MSYEIRPEQRGDEDAIYALTQRAFEPMPYAGGNEQDLINKLRERGELHLSLVVEADGTLIGQVTFSAASLDGKIGQWYALGPVAIDPKWQGRGIGAELINAGLKAIQEQGSLGCILTGNPAYYTRFGSKPAASHVPAEQSTEYFMVKQFNDAPLIGRFAFNPAFYED